MKTVLLFTCFFELTWSNKGFAVDTSILNELPPVAAQTKLACIKILCFSKRGRANLANKKKPRL